MLILLMEIAGARRTQVVHGFGSKSFLLAEFNLPQQVRAIVAVSVLAMARTRHRGPKECGTPR